MGLFTNYEKLIDKGIQLYREEKYIDSYSIFKQIPERKRTKEVFERMGIILLNGLNHEEQIFRVFGGGKEDRKEGEQYLLKAMTLGSETAGYFLGMAYARGRLPGDSSSDNDSKIQYEKTIEYLTPFAENENLKAVKELGFAYLYGYSPNHFLDRFELSKPNPGRDFKKAFYYLSIAARNGVAEVYGVIAEMYEYGRGVEKDLRLAEYFYEKAAREFGDPAAMEKLSKWRY